MRTALVVFTRDLRLHDHPGLCAAAHEFDAVVPLFGFDDAILRGPHAAPNRVGFLLDALADLDGSLRAAGNRLTLRRGNWQAEVLDVAHATGADAIFITGDSSAYAHRREAALATACTDARIELRVTEGNGVVGPGVLQPGGGGEFKVFTPYYRRWLEAGWRTPLRAPASVRAPATPPRSLDPPALTDLVDGERSPDAPATVGGETEGRARLNRWVRSALAAYGDRHDDLPGDATSHLSPYLHLGCVSALEVATKLRERPGGAPFVRQLCWRDFYLQVLDAVPGAAWNDYRDRGDAWNDGAPAHAALEAWKLGRTGYPVVDAGMRQLAAEGLMHNRARLIVASFLTKDLYVDWREGARHFLALLLDGDIANNNLNWQWTAGTGTDTNPHRIFNPTTQAKRFDPQGDYVRHYVPELAGLAGGAVHEPWLLPPLERIGFDYPEPIVDHHEAIAAYKARAAATRGRISPR